jgi:hypothetical protein
MVFGRGPAASVDVRLDDDSKITFDRFSDVAKPGVLSGYLVTTVGVFRTFKGAEAGAVAGAIHRLAQHHANEGEDDVTKDLTEEFLRLAPSHDVDMRDQGDRWRAFSMIAEQEKLHVNPEDRSAHAIASRSTVLVDVNSGKRYVRASWFASYVRAEAGPAHASGRLAIAVQRVGWTRPNSQGRIKATNPTDRRTLSWCFHVVPASREDPPEAQVTASYGSNARAHTHARKTSQPAITCNLSTDRCHGQAATADDDGLDDLGPERLQPDEAADAHEAAPCICQPPGAVGEYGECSKCGRAA